MFKKGTKLYSVFQQKCPRCHEGDFFISSNYDLKRIGDLHVNCEKCGLKFTKEPGFYYGAMYVSYALGVALFVTIWVLFSWFLENLNVGWLIAAEIIATVLLSPYLYALSKIIWANMFVKYDKDAIKRNQK